MALKIANRAKVLKIPSNVLKRFNNMIGKRSSNWTIRIKSAYNIAKFVGTEIDSKKFNSNLFKAIVLSTNNHHFAKFVIDRIRFIAKSSSNIKGVDIPDTYNIKKWLILNNRTPLIMAKKHTCDTIKRSLHEFLKDININISSARMNKLIECFKIHDNIGLYKVDSVTCRSYYMKKCETILSEPKQYYQKIRTYRDGDLW
jgi:hypothetical protein